MRLRVAAAIVGAFCIAGAVPFPAASAESGEYLHYSLGVKYKNEKLYDKAIDEFRKVLAEYPDNYNVYMHIAEIRLAQGEPKLAIVDLQKALSYNPGWSKADKLLAGAYENSGELQKAVESYQLYQKVCSACGQAEQDSVQGAIDRLISKIGSGTEQTHGSDSLGLRATNAKKLPVESSNPGAAELFKAAIKSYDEQRYDTALKQFRKVLALQPDYSGAYYFAGCIRCRMKQDDLAKINFFKSRNYSEPGQAALLCLGKIYGREGNYREAIRQLSRYVKVTNSEQGKKEAVLLLEQYRSLAGGTNASAAAAAAIPPRQEAAPAKKTDSTTGLSGAGPMLEIRIDSLLSMVTVDTLSEAGHKLLGGITEFQKGNYDRAIREFKKLSATYPTGPVAVQCSYNCGVCYFKMRLFREAENQFQQVVDRYPNDPLASQSLFLRALIYSESREPAIAESQFRTFIQACPLHRWAGKAWEKLGDAYTDLEQPKKAVEAYTQAVALANNGGDQVVAYYKSGTAYAAMGNEVRAFSCFDSAIAKGDRNNVYYRVPDSYFRCADEKYRMKDYPGALAYYTKAIRKYQAFQETPWGLFQIGNIHKNLQHYREAIDTYKDLIKRFPDDYWAKQAQWKLEDAVWENDYLATHR